MRKPQHSALRNKTDPDTTTPTIYKALYTFTSHLKKNVKRAILLCITKIYVATPNIKDIWP
jgi:hypothetical protein